MLLRVVHETRYEYASPVRMAQHIAHLQPAQTGRQRLLGHRLEIGPTPVQQIVEGSDVFGNRRTFFSLRSAHDTLKVTAHSLVETSPPAGAHGLVSCGEARGRMRYHRQAVWDPAAEFVFASPHVPRHPDFLAYAQPSFAPGRPLLQAAQELMRRIHADFEFVPGATDVSTPALRALQMRKGVCQDFAHIMLACLRSAGLPGRYVSGYLLTRPPPGQPRLVGSDASHAWISVYVPESGDAGGHWVDLDPTNARLPDEAYVTLATGRDYSDVSPLRGVIHGGARHRLRVAVTVSQVEDAAAAPGSTPA